GDGCPRPATAMATREERIFSRYCLGSDGPFDNVGIDFDTAVEEEAPENLPSGGGVADRLASFDFPEIRGNSVSQSLKRSATMAAERSRRAVRRTASSQPRISSSIFQSPAIVVIVCVAICELPLMCSS